MPDFSSTSLPHRISRKWLFIAVVWVFAHGFTGSMVFCDTLSIALASNFTSPMIDVAKSFEEQTGHSVTLAPGSSGKHFAQIQNGAPFDIFFSADSKRPKRLESGGLAISGSRFTYALGRLVLWTAKPDITDLGEQTLKTGEFRFLAVANPRLAPYGRAAWEVLGALGLHSTMEGRIVQGENITQAFQYIRSENAELGFIAYSQVKALASGSFWLVPQDLYSPIEQQAVLLKDKKAAREFLAFVRSEKARQIIQGHGYGLPPIKGGE